MRPASACLFAVTLACSSGCLAQHWEVGGAGGFGFSKDVTISNLTRSGEVGFEPRGALGVVFGQDLYSYVGGEFRYTYRGSNLKVSSAGQKANFTGDAHAFHYDMLFYGRPAGSRVRPFAAGGLGVKFYRGTGQEAAFQPLSNFALLSKTREVKALISFGGGVKYAVAPHILIRLDFRDYATPFPRRVIVPARSTKLTGWLHDFVPMFGISFTL